MDTEYQAGTEGLKYAASKGFAVVIMEPIGGGKLAINPPEQIQKIWRREGEGRSPAEWALQWVWNHPEVSVVLSGMSTMSQVVENVKSANRSTPNSFSEADFKLIDKIRRRFQELGFIGCTNCKYCLPCPEGVDIPQIIAFYNKYFASDRDEKVKKEYRKQINPESRVNNCVRCGKCEELCPQQLPIRSILSRASWVFKQ
jgi:predicted aldo/keto reductase-like oxidoreductase